jgi:hypothetical protein
MLEMYRRLRYCCNQRHKRWTPRLCFVSFDVSRFWRRNTARQAGIRARSGLAEQISLRGDSSAAVDADYAGVEIPHICLRFAVG